MWRLLSSGAPLDIDGRITFRNHWRDIILETQVAVEADQVFRTKAVEDEVAKIISEVGDVISEFIGRYNQRHRTASEEGINQYSLFPGIMAEIGIFLALQYVFPSASVRLSTVHGDRANTDIVVELEPKKLVLIQVKSRTDKDDQPEISVHKPDADEQSGWARRFRKASNIPQEFFCLPTNITVNRIAASARRIDIATGYPSTEFVNKLTELLFAEHTILDRILRANEIS